MIPTAEYRVPEIWDPTTQQITQVAAASNAYRGYHSTATLLPDGRVLITGGDHDSGGVSQNLNAEIYSPAYLFNGARPTITSAPASAELGETFFVATPDAASIAAVNMLVPGSTTHSQNWTQRINHLEFTPVIGGVEITLPSNSNAAPPGYYMLFLLNDNGVPSIAEFIRAELPTSGLPGDFNDDGDYECSDVDALVIEIAAAPRTPRLIWMATAGWMPRTWRGGSAARSGKPALGKCLPARRREPRRSCRYRGFQHLEFAQAHQ